MMRLGKRICHFLKRLEYCLSGHSAETNILCAEIGRLDPNRTRGLLDKLIKGLRNDTLEMDRFNAAEAISAAIYPKYRFSEYGRIFLEDQDFLEYYRRCMDVDNWHSLDRKYTLDQLLKLTQSVEGNAAECGAYKGFSAYLICKAFQDSGRLVHLFDSFQGLSAPGSRDGDYWTQGALSSPEETLRDCLVGFDNYRVHRGWIPERFGGVIDERFSFVHVDVDLYQPTLDSLEFFYERMSRGGVVLMDDYGFSTCPGAKQAADEFFSDRPEPIVMLPTGQAFVVKQ
jgi:hypothetical protein